VVFDLLVATGGIFSEPEASFFFAPGTESVQRS